jgi:hypothetical protein
MASLGAPEAAAGPVKLTGVRSWLALLCLSAWGTAILSRWPLGDDRKLLLPHGDPCSNTRRIAIAARAHIGDRVLLVYSASIRSRPS